MRLAAYFPVTAFPVTAYLLRSPENARRLLASVDRLEHGGGVERDCNLNGVTSGTEETPDD